jgi:hypothetical protein
VIQQKVQDPLAQLLLERGSATLSVTADVNADYAIELRSDPERSGAQSS